MNILEIETCVLRIKVSFTPSLVMRSRYRCRQRISWLQRGEGDGQRWFYIAAKEERERERERKGEGEEGREREGEGEGERGRDVRKGEGCELIVMLYITHLKLRMQLPHHWRKVPEMITTTCAWAVHTCHVTNVRFPNRHL